MIKLVLSDMDNTLIPFGDRHPSARTRKAIHELLDTGVLFGPDTGRDYVELMRLFAMDEACFQTGIISTGKRIRARGTYISQTSISHDLLTRVHQTLLPEPDKFLVCYPLDTNLLNPAYAIGDINPDDLAFCEKRFTFNGAIVPDVPDIDFVAATIACMGGAQEMDRTRRIIAEACADVDLVSPVPNWFDVLPKGISKASGLDVLLKATGIDYDEVVIFGDAENDLEILRKVPYSVAVANATPEVLRTANYVVGASKDDGVACALEEITRAVRAGEMPRFLTEGEHD